MEYSVCIDALFQGKGFLDGMRTVHRAGIHAFEFWSWWDKDLVAIAVEQEKLGMKTAALCTKFYSLVDPKEHSPYLEGLQESIDAAKRLHCKTLISQVGADTGEDRVKQHAALVHGLKRAVPLLEQQDMTLVVEPLNTAVDHAGYYLSASEEAFALVREVGSEHIKILFDIYHQQITEGDILRTIQKNLAAIGHFHAAGNPGRAELDRGELNYPYIFQTIKELGYQGYLGLEYFPQELPEKGFTRLPVL